MKEASLGSLGTSRAGWCFRLAYLKKAEAKVARALLGAAGFSLQWRDGR